MNTEQVNLRLEEALLEEIERVAREESLDRGTVIRRLLKDSLKRWQLERALRGYERGELSIGRAAEEAGLTQWELIDALRGEEIAYPMRGSDVHERVQALTGEPPSTRGRGSGFQVQMEWMGSTLTTLADVPPHKSGIVLVGINPAPVSVAAGHYYQGRLGKRLWARLARLGLLAEPIVPGAEDEAFVRAGHGLTDLVKRPTASAAEIRDSELRMGADLLRYKIKAWRPRLILFPFKRAAIMLLPEPDLGPGRGPDFEGVATFLLSGPYAPGEDARRIDEALLKLLTKLHTRPLSAAKGGEPIAPRPRRSRAELDSSDQEAILTAAGKRFGVEAVRRYMESERQSDAAQALRLSGKRLRDITRRHGVYVTRGGVWSEEAKLTTLAEILRRGLGGS